MLITNPLPMSKVGTEYLPSSKLLEFGKIQFEYLEFVLRI